MGELDLPFEDQEPTPAGPIPQEGIISAGVVISAITVPLPDDKGHVPGLMFRFAKADGTGFADPIYYVGADLPGFERLPYLVRKAVQRAMKVAKGL